jgi:hypothetical protein
LLLEENGNVGSLYVSNRNSDGIIHFIFYLTIRHHRLRASDSRLKSKRNRGVRVHGVVRLR